MVSLIDLGVIAWQTLAGAREYDRPVSVCEWTRGCALSGGGLGCYIGGVARSGGPDSGLLPRAHARR